jgi:subtilisin
MYLRSGLALVLLAGLSFAGDLQVIVGFKGDVDGAIVRKHGGRADRSLDGIGAMTATIPAARLARLRADPSVAYVEENGFVSAFKPGNGKGGPPDKGGDSGGDPPPPQDTPWGIDRVGGGLTTNTGAGIKVAVIDSGIDLGHEDLAGNIKGGVDFTGSRKGAEDEYGHGSHVAGTIAALDNDRGVIGVAPGAHLYAVRVLDRRGWGRYGDVAAGIEWAADNGMQIANMSLGGGHSSAVQDACSYAQATVLLIASAGNDGDGSIATSEWSYPAGYSSVVSIGATTSSDGLASFSNTNAQVEFSGPGVGVLSTYKKNGYATFNGTSMASPHAAGVAALIWKAAGSTNAAAVRSAMQAKADDAGSSGRDNGFGYGIVDFSN